MGILPRIVLWILAAVAGVVVLWFLLLGIAAIFINPEKEYEKNSRFCRFLLNGSTAVAMKLLRIHVHVSGLENSRRDDFCWWETTAPILTPLLHGTS